MNSNEMIKIESLNKSFGRIKALNDLNLNVKRGELLGIIGPNGQEKQRPLEWLVAFSNQILVILLLMVAVSTMIQ